MLSNMEDALKSLTDLVQQAHATAQSLTSGLQPGIVNQLRAAAEFTPLLHELEKL
jgi:hypothetical protein